MPQILEHYKQLQNSVVRSIQDGDYAEAEQRAVEAARLLQGEDDDRGRRRHP